jgi:hypothetical protein
VQIRTTLNILAVGCGMFFMASCGPTHAQVVVGLGPAPVCPYGPYGYYEAPPYNCAPDGYYGPEWFSGGVFIGAGPWYGGPGRFYGHVDHNLDYRKGYRGPFPKVFSTHANKTPKTLVLTWDYYAATRVVSCSSIRFTTMQSYKGRIFMFLVST